ncbi:MAG TPA: YoaK family protein [Reyranella sp.]|nr:YoaK family protein [Reyranella sp.]
MSLLSPSARDTAQATILTVIAGIADAVGYITMGGVFAANMTGNTVLAGIAAAQRNYTDTWHHLAPLLAFFVGAMLSRLLLRLSHKPTAGLLIEAALLAVVGFLPLDREVAVMIVAVAMGVQASAITHFAGSAVSTVVVTSTLARTADALLDRLWAGEKKQLPAVTNLPLLGFTWMGYLVGAVAGTLLLAVMPYPLLVPVALLGLLLLL